MKNVLVVSHINTFFTELFQVGRLLNQSGKYEATFVLYPYPTRDLDQRKLVAEGFKLVDAPVVERHRVHVPVVTPVVELEKSRRKIRALLDRTDFAMVVLGGDMVGYDTSIYVQECHRRGIPVVLVPSTMSDGLEQAEVYYHDRTHQMTGLNRIAARLYPKWVFEHRGKKLLRVPGGRVMAMEWLGLAPPLPWIFNSGYADAIAIESAAMLKYYERCGITGDQLVVTGSLSDDVLAQAKREAVPRREEVYEKLGLPAGRPMLLSPLPPDFLYVSGGRPECEFKTYRELVDYWITSLMAVTTHNVVISLHPSVRYEEMKFIETDRVKIGRQGTNMLVPLCDLYVASVSSTIRWAIACGIPVINYDVYRYRYRDYAGVDGVLHTEDKTQFRAWLARDAAFFEELRAKQQIHAPLWGALDGKSGERVLALFDDVTERRRTSARSF
jgi:hypothetical protein